MQKFLPFALGLLLAVSSLTACAQSTHSGLALEAPAQAQITPRFTAVAMDIASPRQPYAFFPQGGTIYDDLYLQNFYDLNADSGPANILDWAGTNFALDGGTGEDSILRSFAEQDQGVPVFAALDGTVSTAIYSDPGDHRTASSAVPGNYIILDHGAGQQTGYFSLAYDNPASPDPRYTALQSGQAVRAGTQIGLVGSSGNSTGPHLHFQSSLNGAAYEPFAGPQRPGPSWWVNQPAVRRDLSLDAFNVDAGNVSSPAPSADLPRQAAFPTATAGSTSIGGWAILHNLPANSYFRLRWLRPDGSVYHDTRAGGQDARFRFTGSDQFQRTVEYYWNYTWTPGLDRTGTWHLELTLNNQLVQTAPFFVIAPGTTPARHAPYAVTATLDPALPTASDAVFCRVATAADQDGAPVVVSPDSALVLYHYHWYAGAPGPGAVHLIRDVTTAGHADAIPWGQAPVGYTLACTVTPVDSSGLVGPATVVSAVVGRRTAVQLAVGPNNAPRLLWVTPTGLTSLWNIDGSGDHTYRTYGPFAGWTPSALAVGPDNLAHVLWNNVDGTVALWRVDSLGGFTNTAYGPFAGLSAVGLAVGPDNMPRILWNKTDGTASLWKVNSDGGTAHVDYGPYSGWTAKAVAVGPDNIPRILWTKADGTIALWSVNANGGFTNLGYGPYPGWSAVGLAVGPDNAPRILWNKINGEASLWRVNPDGSTVHAEHGPYTGWTANSVGIGADNHPRMIWTNVNGQASVWDIDTTGARTNREYGL